MISRIRGLLLSLIIVSFFALPHTTLLAQDQTPTANSDGAVTLITLGDSLTEGEGDSLELGGYPGRLLKLIDAVRPDSTLTNVGHSGWNSDALINGDQGLPSELDQALEVVKTAVSRGDTAVALVWIGSNDLFYLYEYGDPDATAEADDVTHYQTNLDLIVSQLKDAGATVLLARLDDQSQRPVTQAGLAFTNISKAEIVSMGEQVKRYNEVITKIADQYGLTTVDFYDTTIFTDTATLSDDGNHPNPDGYDIIAQRWFDALQPILSGDIQAADSLLDDTLLKDTSLLDDTPCAAPCWLNIHPGETAWDEALSLIEADGRFSAGAEQKDETSDFRAVSFSTKDSPTLVVRVYSSADGTTVNQALVLLAPNQITLKDVLAKYGEPAYVTGGDVVDTGDQALVALFYPSVPLVVYVFAPGIKEGSLTEDSTVIGSLYLTSADMDEILSSNGLYTWRGYGNLAGWLDAAPDVTPDVQATSQP